jgi:23S rRNA pseudouridine1911/1915/1917 synthase
MKLQVPIRYADKDIVVVDKPPGVTTMRHPSETAEFGARGRRFLPPTLADLLPALLARHEGRPSGRVRPVHRLDKETSGLVVFARNPRAEGHLGKQFRAHAVKRTYLALVRGEVVPEVMESSLVPDRGDGRRGSSSARGAGKRAVTHARVVQKCPGYALVECRLETGRTHQVRIHLGEAGAPICGERVYDRPLHGAPYPDGSGAPRIALHAATLGIIHPGTGKPMQWSSPLPADLAAVWQRLRNPRKP